MYIEDWDSFYVQAEELWRNDPIKTRYSIKYRHTDGNLVLKVTDDAVCLKYRTDQLVDVKRMEKLNKLMFAMMARGPDAHLDDEDMPQPEPRQATAAAQQQQHQQAPHSGGSGKPRGGKATAGRRKG